MDGHPRFINHRTINLAILWDRLLAAKTSPAACREAEQRLIARKVDAEAALREHGCDQTDVDMSSAVWQLIRSDAYDLKQACDLVAKYVNETSGSKSKPLTWLQVKKAHMRMCKKE